MGSPVITPLHTPESIKPSWNGRNVRKKTKKMSGSRKETNEESDSKNGRQREIQTRLEGKMMGNKLKRE